MEPYVHKIPSAQILDHDTNVFGKVGRKGNRRACLQDTMKYIVTQKHISSIGAKRFCRRPYQVDASADRLIMVQIHRKFLWELLRLFCQDTNYTFNSAKMYSTRATNIFLYDLKAPTASLNPEIFTHMSHLMLFKTNSCEP